MTEDIAQGRDGVIAELRANAALIVIAIVGVAGGLAIGIATGRANWPVYLVVVAVGGMTAVVVHLRYRLTLVTRVGLVVFALGHVAGGMVPSGDDVLYGRWLLEPIVRYDNVQHAWGFGFVGRAVWEVLRTRLGPVADDAALVVWIIVLGAVGAGAINEIVEWILTLTIAGTDVGGYDNTVRDLVANLVGGGLVAAATVAGQRRRSNDLARPS